jgi:multiple antibiotic resistance protein
MAKHDGIAATFAVLGALGANLVLTLLALLAAGPLMRLVGPKIEGMVTRLLGVILAALAVQFVLDGIEATLIAELATS